VCNFGLSDLPWPLRSLGHGPQHRGGSWRSPVCAARHPKQPEQPPSRRRNAGQDVDDAEDPGPLLPGERLRHETCGCLCRHGCGRPVPSWPCGRPGGGCRLGQHGHGGSGGSQGDKPCAGTLPESFIHRLMDTPPPRERSAGPVTSLGGLSDFVVPDQYFQCKWLCPAPDRITHRPVAACRSFVRATAAALLPVWTHRSDPFRHSWSRAQTLPAGMMRRVRYPRSLQTAKECATGASQARQRAQDRALATKDRLGSTR
jgi:hypothetical protein